MGRKPKEAPLVPLDLTEHQLFWLERSKRGGCGIFYRDEQGSKEALRELIGLGLVNDSGSVTELGMMSIRKATEPKEE